MSFWSVPRLWPGATVAILASGPSMNQAVADRVRAAGLPAIAINDTCSYISYIYGFSD